MTDPLGRSLSIVRKKRKEKKEKKREEEGCQLSRAFWHTEIYYMIQDDFTIIMDLLTEECL